MNRLAMFLAGMVVGAAGIVVAKEAQKGGLKGIVQGGQNIVEKSLATVETLKEDVEDYLAEAKYLHEEKLAAQAEEHSEAHTEATVEPEEPQETTSTDSTEAKN